MAGSRVFCAAAALIVGVLFGLVPAWQATRTSLLQAISSESRSSTRRGGRFRNVLVAAEVAAAVVLLCGAGLLLRTMLALGSFDPGYRADSDSVLTLDFSLPGPRPGTRYPNIQSITQFYDQATRDVSAIPGVAKIGWSTGLPYGTTSEIGRLRAEIVGDPPVAPDDRPLADFQAATPGYFDTLDLPIIVGRGFTDRDTFTTQIVCIVNEAFVRRYLGGRDPIGVRLATAGIPGLFPSVSREIVGVVRQLKDRLDDPEPPAQIFVPLAQFPWTDTYLVVQASTRTSAVAAHTHSRSHRADRSRRARQTRPDADRSRQPHHGTASIPGGDGRHVRGAGAAAGDGRHLRRAGVFGRAALA